MHLIFSSSRLITSGSERAALCCVSWSKLPTGLVLFLEMPRREPEPDLQELQGTFCREQCNALIRHPSSAFFPQSPAVSRRHRTPQIFKISIA